MNLEKLNDALNCVDIERAVAELRDLVSEHGLDSLAANIGMSSSEILAALESSTTLAYADFTRIADGLGFKVCAMPAGKV